MQSDRARARTPTQPASSAALRAFSLFALLLLASTPFAQLAHFLLVPHAVCSAHGELVELAPHAAGTRQAPSKSEASAPREQGPGGDESAEHDHCQLVACAARGLGLVPVTQASVLPPAHVSTLVLLAARLEPQVLRSVIELAPKTSPPSRRPSAV